MCRLVPPSNPSGGVLQRGGSNHQPPKRPAGRCRYGSGCTDGKPPPGIGGKLTPPVACEPAVDCCSFLRGTAHPRAGAHVITLLVQPVRARGCPFTAVIDPRRRPRPGTRYRHHVHYRAPSVPRVFVDVDVRLDRNRMTLMLRTSHTQPELQRSAGVVRGQVFESTAAIVPSHLLCLAGR